MKFRVKKHWYMGDGWMYDLYHWNENINNWDRHPTPLGSLDETVYWAKIIKRDLENENKDEIISEFEL